MSLTGDDNQALIWMFGVVAIFQIIVRVESFLTEVTVETIVEAAPLVDVTAR